MEQSPHDPKKLQARIRRYERAVRREFEQFGFYDDSDGKRYLLGPLYLLLGDLSGALSPSPGLSKPFQTMVANRSTGYAGRWPFTALAISAQPLRSYARPCWATCT